MVFGINNDIFTNEIRKFKVELQFLKLILFITIIILGNILWKRSPFPF